MNRALRIYLADLVHDYLPGNYVVPLNVGLIGCYLNVPAKNIRFSDGASRLIETIYPHIAVNGNECAFEMPLKRRRAIKSEMQKYGAGEDPVRALALTLENFSYYFQYEFRFSH